MRNPRMVYLMPFIAWTAISAQIFGGTFMIIMDWAMRYSYAQDPERYPHFKDVSYR